LDFATSLSQLAPGGSQFGHLTGRFPPPPDTEHLTTYFMASSFVGLLMCTKRANPENRQNNHAKDSM
jgi:hypothetical protein